MGAYNFKTTSFPISLHHTHTYISLNSKGSCCQCSFSPTILHNSVVFPEMNPVWQNEGTSKCTFLVPKHCHYVNFSVGKLRLSNLWKEMRFMVTYFGTCKIIFYCYCHQNHERFWSVSGIKTILTLGRKYTVCYVMSITSIPVLCFWPEDEVLCHWGTWGLSKCGKWPEFNKQEHSSV